MVGSQLNWSAREKECYGIYYGVRLFEDLLDNRYFILKTDYVNLTYINVTFTGLTFLRWKLYLQDKDFDLYHVPGKEEHQFVPDALSRICANNDGGGKGGGSRVHFDDRSRDTPCRTDIVTHLTCNCGGSDINSTYRQCLVTLATSSTYFTALTLFDTGAVNREVAKWLEQRHEGDKEGGLDGHRRFSRHDIPTSVVGLAGMTMNSSIYGSVVFDLTLFNEATRTDYVYAGY